jgi:antitoxin CptB
VSDTKTANYTRNLWRAHRGMLELDLFLIPFIKNQWFELSPHNQEVLEQFLQCQDPELFAWLMGHEVPEQQEFMHLVESIRQYMQATT